MKLKRFLAAALAGVMAITSSVVTSVTASAEVALADGSVVDLSNTTIATNLGTVDWSSSNVYVSADTLASFNLTAGTYLTIDFTTVSGGQFYCTNFNDWSASATWYNESGSATLALTATMISEGIRFNGADVTIDKVSYATVNAEYEAGSTWSLNASVDWSSSNVAVSAADFAKSDIVAGTTYLKIDFTTVSGGQFYCTNFNNWSASATWYNESGSALVAVTSAMVSEGIRFNGADVTITTITAYNPPATKYAITTTTPTNGTLSVDKTEAAEGETVTVTANPATGYELEAITVNGTAITGTTFEMPAEAVTVAATFKAAETEEPEEDVLESGTYTDGTWEQLSADEIAALGNLNTNTIVGDEYLTTQNVLSVQYSASEKKFRIYQLYSEKDLADKSSASIVVKKGDVALRLTTECVYTTIADGQTAPDGSYYIAWVISGVEDPTAFSYSGITLA